jgi:hypothetical protein
VLESLTFVVVEGGAWSPQLPRIAGATVTLDAPGGERVERSSGVDGKVTFDGIDWSLGAASATAYLPEHALYSVLDLEHGTLDQVHLVDGAIPLVVEPLTPELVEGVTLKGNATGLIDPSHQVIVSVAHQVDVGRLDAGAPETAALGDGSFVLTAPRGEPFVLQAYERLYSTLPSGQGFDAPIYQVAHKAFDGFDVDTADLAIDFGIDGLETFTGEVTLELPARAESPLRAGWPYIYVCPRETWYCTGWPTRVDISADGGRFELEMLWVEPEWASPRVWAGVMESQAAGVTLGGLYTDAYPESGSLGTVFDNPLWVSPSSSSEPHPIHEPFEWQLLDEGATDALLVVRSSDGKSTRWLARPGPGRTTLTLPPAPSAVDEGTWLGAHQRAELLVGTMDWERIEWTAGAYAERLFLP